VVPGELSTTGGRDDTSAGSNAALALSVASAVQKGLAQVSRREPPLAAALGTVAKDQDRQEWSIV